MSIQSIRFLSCSPNHELKFMMAAFASKDADLAVAAWLGGKQAHISAAAAIG
jgi:hypothetical protein